MQCAGLDCHLALGLKNCRVGVFCVQTSSSEINNMLANPNVVMRRLKLLLLVFSVSSHTCCSHTNTNVLPWLPLRSVSPQLEGKFCETCSQGSAEVSTDVRCNCILSGPFAPVCAFNILVLMDNELQRSQTLPAACHYSDSRSPPRRSAYLSVLARAGEALQQPSPDPVGVRLKKKNLYLSAHI